MAKVDVGDAAPEFELPGTGGRTYRLSDYRGKKLVIAFYPGDFTAVCTKQFCSYRDEGERLDKIGAEVVGISPQGVDSHERFTEEKKLNVPLLADEDKAVAKAYGVVAGPLVRRAIFVVDEKGIDRLPQGDPGRAHLRVGRRPREGRRGGRLMAAEAGEFTVDPAPVLRGSVAGEGTPIVLCHGLTASRRYVVQGSRALERAGHRVVLYDARGHGESDPAPAGAELWIPGADRRPRRGWSRRRSGASASCSAATRWAPTPRSATRSPTRSGSAAWS